MGPLIFYIGGKLFINRLNKVNTISSTVNEESLKEAHAAYRTQIGLGTDFKFNSKTFDDYVTQRRQSIDNLPSIFKHEKVKEALQDAAIKQALIEALSDKNLSKAQGDYKEDTQHFNRLIQKIPPLKAEAVIPTMKEAIDKGVQAIQKQQQLEKESLAKLFTPTPPAKTTAFMEQLREKGVSDIEAAKKAMISDLDIKHEIQLDAFKQGTLDPLYKIHNATQKDFAEYAFLASLSKESEEMKKFIRTTTAKKQQTEIKNLEKEIAEKTQQKSSAAQKDQDELTRQIQESEEAKAAIERKLLGLQMERGTDTETDPHAGQIHLTDLEKIISKTGKEISHSNGVFKLEIGAMFHPSGIISGYVFGNKLEHDLTLLAEAVRASGKSAIVMNVNYSNETVARKRAEQAYRASIEAGFPPEKITMNITVQGKKIEWKPDEVFSPQQMKNFNKRAARVNQKREELYIEHRADLKPVKDELARLKQAYKSSQENDNSLENTPDLLSERAEAERNGPSLS